MEKISFSQEQILTTDNLQEFSTYSNNENFVYFCPLDPCTKLCETETLFFEHLLKEHSAGNQCHCGRIYRNEKILKLHKKRMHKCDSTNIKLSPFLEKNKLLFLSETSLILNTIECPICAFHAKTDLGLKNHIRVKHKP